MLVITIPDKEYWDPVKEEFINPKGWTLSLEHSLVSISKWEAKWRKPFLSDKEKTPEEIEDYIRCMTLTQNVDPEAYQHLTWKHYRQIQNYIDAPMTATWFSDKTKGKRSSEQVTSELIYYWMIANNIPFECQKWHLNRLMTLIKVCGIKSQPPKKMTRSEILARNAELNAQRRKRLGTKG